MPQTLKEFVTQQIDALKRDGISSATFRVALNPDGTVTNNSITSVDFTIELLTKNN